MSEPEDKRLVAMRERAAKLSVSMDDELDAIRKLPARQAVDRALALGVLLLAITTKLAEVRLWFLTGHPIRPLDIFAFRSVAGDLRQIADALEAAANRAEQEG